MTCYLHHYFSVTPSSIINYQYSKNNKLFTKSTTATKKKLSSNGKPPITHLIYDTNVLLL